MRQTWRWFGPHDLVSVDDMLQAGVEGVVSALHHVPTGVVWTPEEIARRQDAIGRRADGSPSGLRWEVVESLPVSEAIKTQVGEWRSHLANYRTSLENLARAGISVICYNFMPVLDWTRTDLAWRLPHGGTTMRFDLIDFAAFDIHILKRQAALGDYTPEIAAEAERRYAQMDDHARKILARSVNSGLPGSTEDTSLDGLAAQLSNYDRIDATTLRRHFVDFLAEVVPTAERLGLRLCCHPDDRGHGGSRSGSPAPAGAAVRSLVWPGLRLPRIRVEGRAP